jgi:hypothetical protein
MKATAGTRAKFTSEVRDAEVEQAFQLINTTNQGFGATGA